MSTPRDVIDFWFGTLREDGTADPDVVARWWKKDPAFDASIRERFGEAVDAAARGDLDAWAATPEGRVALIILLDQFSRNVHRGSPRAFAGDGRALALAIGGRELGDLETLPPMHAYFLAMPFMHAEDLGAQEACVEAMKGLAARAPNDTLRKTFAGGADFAERHRVIVERFGRFPHRNAILGRPSTREEEAFLAEPFSSF
jgi:uncharacterized protein (DUF924 family)